MAERGSKLDQIRALREARILAGERAASASDLDKKSGAKSTAAADPAHGE
jgi:hypothetical protein